MTPISRTRNASRMFSVDPRRRCAGDTRRGPWRTTGDDRRGETRVYNSTRGLDIWQSRRDRLRQGAAAPSSSAPPATVPGAGGAIYRGTLDRRSGEGVHSRAPRARKRPA